MKALNVPIHDTPVGLVACLPPAATLAERVARTWAEPGDVLGVVRDCEYCSFYCSGGGWGCADRQHDDCDCECDGTGYAPLKFVKVLAVWPIVLDGYDGGDEWDDDLVAIDIVDDGVGDKRSGTITMYVGSDWFTLPASCIPDAEPGGVALHVERTDCPTCGGATRLDGDGRPTKFGWPYGWLCPTCQTPFAPPSDGPNVEVK